MDTPSNMPRRKSVSAREVSAVTALPGPQRYAHFVTQVADWQEVWALRSGKGWVSAAGDSAGTSFPVWPHEPYARQCVAGNWSDSAPEPIEVHEFLATFVPNMAKEGTQVAVFPTPSGAVVLVSAEEFASSVRAELSRLE